MVIDNGVTNDDVVMMREFLALIPENQCMHMPLTRLFYRISHNRRMLYLINADALLHEFDKIVHFRIKRVCALIGYRVVDKASDST